MNQWVVCVLTPQGEEEDPEVLAKYFKRQFQGHEFFIPAVVSTVNGNRVVTKLIDNYVFVRQGLANSVYKKAENTRYIQEFLMKPASRREFSVVLDKEVEKMRSQLAVVTNQDIAIGDFVEILSGPYRHMVVKVLEEIPEKGEVQVLVELRSKQTILTFPRDFLRFRHRGEENDQSSSLVPYINRLQKTGKWLKDLRNFLVSLPPVNPKIKEVIKRRSEAHKFEVHRVALENLLRDYELPDFQPLLDRVKSSRAFEARCPVYFQLEHHRVDIDQVVSRLNTVRNDLAVFKVWLRKLQQIEGKLRQLDHDLSIR